MKRSSAGSYPTYRQASKRQKSGYPKRNPGRDYSPKRAATRKGYGSVARARGAAVQGEMKYFDCDRTLSTLAAVTTTWVATTILDPLTSINLGDAAVATPACLCAPKVSAALNGRIGRKIKVFKIKVNGTLNVPVQAAQAAGDAASKVRLLLVQDTQTNAAQMTSAQLLNDATGAETTINSFQNPNNFGRFRVLKDKMFRFENPSMAGTTPTIDTMGLKQYFKMSINFKSPVLCNFNATNGGTVADIIDNSFHIICATDSTGLTPAIAYYSRVCYKE